MVQGRALNVKTLRSPLATCPSVQVKVLQDVLNPANET